MATNIFHRYEVLLENYFQDMGGIRRLEKPQEALRLLQQRYESAEDGHSYSILGQLLKSHLFLSSGAIDSIQWVLLQYKNKYYPVGDTIYAVSPQADKKLDYIFDEFYKDYDNKTNAWLTMTDIINVGWRNNPNPPYAHAVVSDLSIEHGSAESYREGKLALYGIPILNDNNITIPIKHTSGKFEIELPNDISLIPQPKGLWSWLNTFGLEKHWVYLGINFTDSMRSDAGTESKGEKSKPDPMRLWILIDKPDYKILDDVIRSMALLEQMLESLFFHDISRYISYEDSTFMKMFNKKYDFHNKLIEFENDWSTNTNVALNEIFDYLKLSYGHSIIKQYVRSIFGETSKCHTGSSCLNLEGALFMIAYVVIQVAKKHKIDQKNNKNYFPEFEDKSGNQTNNIELLGKSCEGKEAQKAIMSLLMMLYKLIEWRDGDRESNNNNPFALTKITYEDDLIILSFCFNPLTSKYKRTPLNEKLRVELTNNGHDAKKEISHASTTRKIVDFLKNAEKFYVHDQADNMIYPLYPRMSFVVENEILVVRLGKIFSEKQHEFESFDKKEIVRFSINSNHIGIYDTYGGDGNSDDYRIAGFKECCDKLGFILYRYNDKFWHKLNQLESTDSQEKVNQLNCLFVLCHFEPDTLKNFGSFEEIVWYGGNNNPRAIYASNGYRWEGAVTKKEDVKIDILSKFCDEFKKNSIGTR